MEDKKYRCIYCNYWIRSPVKKSSGNSKIIIQRKCKIRNRLITTDSLSCKYFKPAEIIYCDLNNQRMNILNCLQRRRNPKKFDKVYNDCKRCRQFSLNISEIIEDYYLGSKKILEPEIKLKGRSIKRRGDHPKKRTIKRRIKKQQKKIIKRRKKSRKIKRRQAW